MDLITVAIVLSLVYFSISAVMWVASKKELKELERKKDAELQHLNKKLKRLADKARRRRTGRNR